MENPIELAKKLLELSKRGEAGEKENAERFLQKLLVKHKISMDEISDEHVMVRWFRFKNQEHYKFITQIMASVLGDVEVWIQKNPKEVGTKCTTAEHLEIFEKIEWYWKLWKEEVSVFRSAFIQANKLFTKQTGEHAEPPERTPEEEERIRRLLLLAESVRTDLPVKRLERPEKLTT